MTDTDREYPGARIATTRRLKGWTQDRLARESGYSVSMIRKVERGIEPASPGFLSAVGRVLGKGVDELTGTPYREIIEREGGLGGLNDLRTILAEGHHVRPIEPLPLDELRSSLDAINIRYRNDRGRQALARLPLLIRQLHGALHSVSSHEQRGAIYSLLASAYATVERIARRFGYLELTTPALDRLDVYAASADDPLYAPQGLIKRARVLMYHDSHDVGLTLIEQGLNQVEGNDEGALAVRGYGHLAGAIVAARFRRPDIAREHLSEARKVAAHVDGESDAYGTLFGQANVGIHSVAVELEAGDPGLAAQEGFALRLPESVAPPRAGHHWQDTARACLLSGNGAKALDALNRARKVAPQQTRLHPMVRDTLRGIAALDRRKSDTVANFAAWLGPDQPQ
ncbi:helix-turn-helix domain-containing protein [Actinokineospora iranica]|uniref:Transcriptional regulator, contains XRE-family HTH domain n=1 Tax=Actinokineospora iranica TaxID=1271860 RepID=A0A1G6RF58_9PSEU|nr:helix-turn-helix transcriptional regulator [Actinokineospora iranica]SDD03279.1 Transcriptional regulator, contains XRE-family HTH domain [Actinokineospora iranica]